MSVLHSSSTSRINSFLRNFNHFSEHLHNEEIKIGADGVLYRLLLCLVTDGSGHLAIDTPLSCSEQKRQIISNVCRAIEMVYQCSTEMAETSFQRIGPELLDLLSAVLSAQLKAHSNYHDRAMTSNSPLPISRSRDATIKSVTRIVSSFARVQSAITAIARHGTLITLLEAIVECSKSTISFESQHNAIWILANVACDKSNSLFIVAANKRLLYTLAHVASDPGNILQHSNSRSSVAHCGRVLQLQRSALRCIFNLSFVEKVADQMILQCNNLLSALCQIIILRTETFSRSAYIHEQIVRAKRYASGILYNLSNSGDDKKHLLCRFQNGLLMRSLRDATNCGDAIVERKATQTIANLVIFNRAHVISPLILGVGS